MSLLEMTAGDAAVNRMLQLAHGVVELVNDKGGAAKRLADLAQATATAEGKIAEARAAAKEADKKLSEHEQWIKTDLAEHSDKLLRERQGLEHERGQFEKMRGALIAEQTQLRDQARADADQAAAKLKELNAKLAAIQSAAAA
jgi:chromosome segregation ATPase